MDEIQTSQETVAPSESSSAPVGESQAPASESVVGNEPVAAAAPEVPAYVPNFKYKVKGQEFEIDEDVRPLIKDKDSEAKWRRMYEKANGLDHVLSDKEQLAKQYNEFKTQNEPIVGIVRDAFDHWNRGDKALAFEKLGIPKQDLFKYVFEELKKEELPADQRAAYERAQKAERENHVLKSQFETTQSQFQQMLHQQRFQQVDTALSQPEVSSIATAYDSAKGQPGAFRSLVTFVAGQHFQQTGEDLSAQEAVMKTASMFPQSVMTPAQSNVQNQVVAPSGVPVIPVARGGGVSTVKKQITSVADLEKAYAEMK